MCVWSRPDIPRHELMKLFGQATEIVRLKLEAADPRHAALIRTSVADASDEIQTTARAGSHEHATAVTHVRSLHSRGELDETRLLGFTRDGSFDRTAVALSIMCDLPIGLVERALVQDDGEQILRDRQGARSLMGDDQVRPAVETGPKRGHQPEYEIEASRAIFAQNESSARRTPVLSVEAAGQRGLRCQPLDPRRPTRRGSQGKSPVFRVVYGGSTRLDPPRQC